MWESLDQFALGPLTVKTVTWHLMLVSNDNTVAFTKGPLLFLWHI